MQVNTFQGSWTKEFFATGLFLEDKEEKNGNYLKKCGPLRVSQARSTSAADACAMKVDSLSGILRRERVSPGQDGMFAVGTLSLAASDTRPAVSLSTGLRRRGCSRSWRRRVCSRLPRRLASP